MKRILIFNFLFCLSHAYAVQMNGAGAWVCQEGGKTGPITKIELVDLFEAENEFDYELGNFESDSYEESLVLYKNRLKQLDINIHEMLVPYFVKYEEKMILIDADLQIVNDGLYRVKPNQQWCANGKTSYVQVANFIDDQTVYINKNIFDHPQMSNSERAGIILHDVIYTFMRKVMEEENSSKARRLLGNIASNLNIENARLEIDKSLGTNRECGFSGTLAERIEKCSFMPQGHSNFSVVKNIRYLLKPWDSVIKSKQYTTKVRGLIFYDKNSKLIYANTNDDFYEPNSAISYCLSYFRDRGLAVNGRIPKIIEYRAAYKLGLVPGLNLNLKSKYWSTSYQLFNPNTGTFSGDSESGKALCVASSTGL